MDNKDFYNLGDKIRDTVQSAIDSKDYKQLNKTISDSVNFALDEARRQLTKGMGDTEQAGRKDYHTAYHNSWEEKKSASEGPGYRAFQNSGPEDNLWTRSGRTTGKDIREVVKTDGLTTVMRQPGKVAGILYTVFGSIGLGVTVILFIVIWLLALLVKPFWGAVLGSSVILLLLGGGFTSMLGIGISMRSRLKRAEVYVKQVGSRTYCEIEELARNVGRSPRFVAKDLQKLIEKGILPGAHIDEQKTCLILDETTYKQYLQTQKALKQREQEKLLEKKQRKSGRALKDSQKSAEEVKESSPAEELPEGLAEVMSQGRTYLRLLREANEAIPGEVISDKLDHLETVIRQIFESVERHPEQMGEMEKFMDYYLPTTVKLVNAYRDFDSAKVEGENIISAKKDIEETLDTINGAFERLLDDLYKNKALDASTDAAVLQTMLKKDGWAESDFSRKQEDRTDG